MREEVCVCIYICVMRYDRNMSWGVGGMWEGGGGNRGCGSYHASPHTCTSSFLVGSVSTNMDSEWWDSRMKQLAGSEWNVFRMASTTTFPR